MSIKIKIYKIKFKMISISIQNKIILISIALKEIKNEFV